jgi:phytoene dehydrogenase-like protein
MPFDNGRAFIGWREPERINEQLTSFSKHDATAYHELFAFFNEFARRLGVSLFAPPPTLSELASRLKSPEDELAFSEIMFGSIRDYVDARLESDEVKALVAALAVMSNFVGPSTPGTPCMLLQRPMSLASGTIIADHDPRKQPLRGSTGLPMGGMGGIIQAMEASLRSRGVEIRRNAAVKEIIATSAGAKGVVLANGERVLASTVVSNLNPKTTLLDLLEDNLLPQPLVERLSALRMQGGSFKFVLALSEIPRYAVARNDEEVRAFAGCQFRIAPSMDYMDMGFDKAKLGHLSTHPMMWGLTPTVHDPSLAPAGRHLLSVNVWHAPYHLRDGDWSEAREQFGEHCIRILSNYITNLPDAIIDRRFFSPVDFANEIGLVDGNATHGDMIPGRMFGFRPLPEIAHYRTPVPGLYLCGSGTWPGGTVSGLPGHNSSHQVIADLRRGTSVSRAG